MTDATPLDPPATPPLCVSPDAARAYLDRRVKPQQEWFDTRAADAKTWHYRLAGAQLIATAAIPAVNVFVKSVMASTILAFVAAIAAGFSQLYRHRENWERYRAAAGALESLQLRYQLRLPPFDQDDAPARVIAEADRLLDAESGQWAETMRSAGGLAQAKTPAPVKSPEEG